MYNIRTSWNNSSTYVYRIGNERIFYDFYPQTMYVDSKTRSSADIRYDKTCRTQGRVIRSSGLLIFMLEGNEIAAYEKDYSDICLYGRETEFNHLLNNTIVQFIERLFEDALIAKDKNVHMVKYYHGVLEFIECIQDKQNHVQDTNSYSPS